MYRHTQYNIKTVDLHVSKTQHSIVLFQSRLYGIITTNNKFPCPDKN